MEKYPVISKNGNEYRVSFYELSTIGYTKCVVQVFRKRIWKINLFKRIDTYTFTPKKWEFDYIKMAKRAVDSYEENIEKQKNNDSIEQQNIEKFKQWNGVC